MADCFDGYNITPVDSRPRERAFETKISSGTASVGLHCCPACRSDAVVTAIVVVGSVVTECHQKRSSCDDIATWNDQHRLAVIVHTFRCCVDDHFANIHLPEETGQFMLVAVMPIKCAAFINLTRQILDLSIQCFYLEIKPMATIRTMPETVQMTKLRQSVSVRWTHFWPSKPHGGSGMGGPC